MRIFQPESEAENLQEMTEFRENFEILETTLDDLRQTVVHRRTMLKNVEKKLQEFQDTIYAMIIEDEYPAKSFFPPVDNENHDI